MAELKLFPSAEMSYSPRAGLAVPFELPPPSLRTRTEVPFARLAPSLG